MKELTAHELLGLKLGFYNLVGLLRQAALNIATLAENPDNEISLFMREVQSFGLVLTSVSASATNLHQFPEILYLQQQELSRLLETLNMHHIQCSNESLQKCLAELEAMVASLLAIVSIQAHLATFKDFH